MDTDQKAKLLKIVGEDVRFGCPMAPYTSLRVGGEAEALYEARNLQDLQKVIGYLTEEHIPYLVVGRGSNLLVKAEGLEGVVILLGGLLGRLEHPGTEDGNVLAGAGLPLSDLLRHCRRRGLGGLEFLTWVPGTVGGAVCMNAGAFGSEIGDRVAEIHLLQPGGDLEVRNRSGLRFSYRSLRMEKGRVIVRVRFRLTVESEGVVSQRMANFTNRRKESQPLEYPSAGSVFKNPPNDYAGRLIAEAGLKGKRIGGAMISDKHANFIVNTGGAKAEDVLALLTLAQDVVREKTGIELEPEIQVVGK